MADTSPCKVNAGSAHVISVVCRMEMQLGLMPILFLQATPAWTSMQNSERVRWLENKRAQLAEFQAPPNGVFWADGRSSTPGDIIMILWNLIDEASLNALLAMMRQPDVQMYFTIQIHGGRIAQDQAAIWAPFLLPEP
jgi:hypothetical protein